MMVDFVGYAHKQISFYDNYTLKIYIQYEKILPYFK